VATDGNDWVVIAENKNIGASSSNVLTFDINTSVTANVNQASL